jgi:hypothetical protein
MDTYYISYTVVDRSGRNVGTGTMTYPLKKQPRTHDEVVALAATITDEQHLSGALRAGSRLHILSWQRLGEDA